MQHKWSVFKVDMLQCEHCNARSGYTIPQDEDRIDSQGYVIRSRAMEQEPHFSCEEYSLWRVLHA